MPRLIIILICLFLSFILGLFSLWPKYQYLGSLRAEVENKETELKYIQEYFENLKETSQELTNYEAEISKIDSAIPVDVSIPSLFNSLKNASTGSGLIMKEFGAFSVVSLQENKGEPYPQRAIPTLAMKKISLPIELVGSYPAFKNFLSTLENNAKIFEVESIAFSSGEEGIFAFEIAIETYSY